MTDKNGDVVEGRRPVTSIAPKSAVDRMIKEGTARIPTKAERKSLGLDVNNAFETGIQLGEKAKKLTLSSVEQTDLFLKEQKIIDAKEPVPEIPVKYKERKVVEVSKAPEKYIENLEKTVAQRAKKLKMTKKDYIQRLSTSLENDNTIKTMEDSKAG